MSSGRTLEESMGKKGRKALSDGLSLNDLPDLMGERMPKLEFTRVGRIRLMRRLRDRFGAGFKSLPGMVGMLKEFDEEMDNNEFVAQARSIGGQLG